MSKPYIHAKSSAKLFGGKPSDYLEIHQFMDSPKSTICDVRSRAIFHNSYMLFVLEKIFGDSEFNITNSDGNKVSVREICERHIYEDYGNKFIPSLHDWLSEIEIKPWMHNSPNEYPESSKKLKLKEKIEDYSDLDEFEDVLRKQRTMPKRDIKGRFLPKAKDLTEAIRKATEDLRNNDDFVTDGNDFNDTRNIRFD